jgi:hypothetical protein
MDACCRIRLQWRVVNVFLCKKSTFSSSYYTNITVRKCFGSWLNVRIQKWSNCCELQLWRKFSSNFCFVIKIQFNALFANAGSFFCCWICVSTLFNKNQMLTKVWLSKWFMNVQHLDRVKPHLCSSSQNIKNTFNGFVLQQYMPETIA